MVARGCIFHMPSEGDLYRCTMHREDELVWVLQFAARCTGGRDHAQPPPVGSSSPSMHGALGQSWWVTQGWRRPHRRAEPREEEESVPGGFQSAAWKAGGQATRVGTGEARLARRPKRSANTCQPPLPAPGTRVPRS